jgi:transposase
MDADGPKTILLLSLQEKKWQDPLNGMNFYISTVKKKLEKRRTFATGNICSQIYAETTERL